MESMMKKIVFLFLSLFLIACHVQPKTTLDEHGTYDQKDQVILYLQTYHHLPDNYMDKDTARSKGWNGGALHDDVEGYCIGGDRFGNFEGLLPKKKGRIYYECDIDTLTKKDRGEKRIIFSNDGYIYYTDDHYQSFTLIQEGGSDAYTVH